jgi:hypothetical protein
LGQSLNPYPVYYKPAFAFSDILYPLRHLLSLRSGYHLSMGSIGLTQLMVKEKRTRAGGVFIPEGAVVSLLARLSNSLPLVPFGHSV